MTALSPITPAISPERIALIEKAALRLPQGFLEGTFKTPENRYVVAVYDNMAQLQRVTFTRHEGVLDGTPPSQAFVVEADGFIVHSNAAGLALIKFKGFPNAN